VPPPKDEEEGKVPKTFILRRGKTDKTVGTLVQDLRTMMSPYTAAKLRTRKCVLPSLRFSGQHVLFLPVC
jgi:hypothetical protein